MTGCRDRSFGDEYVVMQYRIYNIIYAIAETIFFFDITYRYTRSCPHIGNKIFYLGTQCWTKICTRSYRATQNIIEFHTTREKKTRKYCACGGVLFANICSSRFYNMGSDPIFDIYMKKKKNWGTRSFLLYALFFLSFINFTVILCCYKD